MDDRISKKNRGIFFEDKRMKLITHRSPGRIFLEYDLQNQRKSKKNRSKSLNKRNEITIGQESKISKDLDSLNRVTLKALQEVEKIPELAN